ncbi:MULTISPECIES: class I SAM-dependent methyltransferase [unclassified Mycolicibacterium]|uniref:class I SAM-dependent methyltransferase n=1 Tax=unclassified Mycolicibacterium TaxID=2636767 RepID=UPI0012DDD1BB|nr:MULTISPECIES: class I SAM-dependent methyltransferase [unclassified Mycolicibacterium]MUL83478.1 class I SAM-dependent methyltransferase [Mycolicibacterium sp. CBMA 329]MUL90469.1 class I SAM-dependent methyltransferase [Mycolicibacterium sp. CBMA 331]MUM00441.1 class I SAM-dependent methyltransferase [Mycolicibacterium sp. CBMA 334]MUM28736.1 class I SAM-dependent methyltransferase [Mycolicibacterium sp. CBMA 295]MUM41413.1 class I SAM-dependent methyltransferase [Mycolicibacterium sp. CBM
MPVIDARHLTAISETALLTLHQRATEAARSDGIIEDPLAITLRDSLGYDYHHFGRTHQATALRALTFDVATRRYLQTHRRASVVALAEGLQTSFWRLDNGEITWLSVDLEPIVLLRQQLLPSSDRLRYLAQSALDHSWMDRVDAGNGVLITAEGLFQYLEHDAVFDLIAACAARFPGGQMIFDSVPRFLSRYSQRRGIRLSKQYTAPPMPFSFTADRYDELRAIPGIRAVYEVEMPEGRGKVLSRAAALVYRSRRLERFRAPTNVIEFG